MCMSSPSVRAPAAPPPPPAATAPKEQVEFAKDKERRKLASAGGRADTLLTSPLGIQDPATTRKATLLGS